jgi:hypothetical protein
MTAQPDEFLVDFPVLGVALDWVEAHCVVPDRHAKGQQFILSDWQAWYYANHYRIKRDAPLPTRDRPAIGAPAFYYRRSQIVMPQKAGKGPLTASQCCLEGMGPAMFAGWADHSADRHVDPLYRCIDNGCPCGWEYEYAPGEPTGALWPTPLIQVTAFSEEQAHNVFGALKPMIEAGPLSEVALRVGVDFVRTQNGGEMSSVTSSNQSRLGQRVTFVPQDEVGLWTETNKMTEVAKTQRRGLAGMQGRASETTNGWDPAENSVAQRTARAALTSHDIFRHHPQAPANLSFKNKRERRKILKIVYRGCPWVDLDAVDAEAAELVQDDPANAERFFGNRIVAGRGAWLKDGVFDATAAPRAVARKEPVAGGFDGSRTSDWTAIRLETRDGYLFTPTYGPDQLPCIWDPAQWNGEIPRAEVNAAMDEIFRTYSVRLFYCDPRDWESEIDNWAATYSDDIVLKWPTYRVIPMHMALVRFHNDITSASPRILHDGNPVAKDHFANARKVAKPADRYILGKPDAHRKIDIAVTSTLAHEAAFDLHADPKRWGPQSRLTRAKGRASVG